MTVADTGKHAATFPLPKAPLRKVMLISFGRNGAQAER